MREIFDTHVDSAAILLEEVAGLGVTSEHGKDTPMRFTHMLRELTCCSDCNGDCMKWKKFSSDTDDLIVVQAIPFSSVCNHHVVPFVGYAHIGYVPRLHIAGLSKFARVVRHFARQLQVQENLTYQIAQFLNRELDPLGVAVVVRAEHLCMTIRGVQSPGTYTTTARMTGVFQDHSKTAKQEFLTYLNGKH